MEKSSTFNRKDFGYQLAGSFASMQGLMNLAEIATTEMEAQNICNVLLLHIKLMEKNLIEVQQTYAR